MGTIRDHTSDEDENERMAEQPTKRSAKGAEPLVHRSEGCCRVHGYLEFYEASEAESISRVFRSSL
jgi:hypothetical protein